MNKRFLSILLCLVMMLGTLPTVVFAADSGTTPTLTPVTAANFSLGSDYKVGRFVTQSNLTMTITPDGALTSPNGYALLSGTPTKTCLKIGIGYNGTGFTQIIMDESVKFNEGITYYLIVLMVPNTGYSFDGLTKENVKLDGEAAIDLSMDGTIAIAIFRLDPLTAPTHTHTKGT